MPRAPAARPRARGRLRCRPRGEFATETWRARRRCESPGAGSRQGRDRDLFYILLRALRALRGENCFLQAVAARLRRIDNAFSAAIVPRPSRESGLECPVRSAPRRGRTYRDNNNHNGKRLEMSKRESSKYKINRRLAVNLWGRPKSPYNKREYGPGQHGQRRRKPSDYGTSSWPSRSSRAITATSASASSAATTTRRSGAAATRARIWSRCWSAGSMPSSTA